MAYGQASVRKTRIVCISDTHNQTPKLPAGDVLIHAGDLTNQGSLSELRRAVHWLENTDFEVKIVIAGNHDITLDGEFYNEHGSYFHNQQRQDPVECQNLLLHHPTITYLNHESRKIRLKGSQGPQTEFTVFGSPYSPALAKRWAFQYSKDNAAQLWNAIPLDTDVVVTHAPPRGHCDASLGNSAGCEALRQALWRVRPKLAVCGHTHEGRGVERVRWRLDIPRCPYQEEGVNNWKDPGSGNNKQSLVDLTGKVGAPLDNHDGAPSTLHFSPRNRVTFSGAPTRTVPLSTFDDGRDRHEPEGLEEQISRLDDRIVASVLGRLGKRETCIINAAHLASSYGMPKRFNKPIVIDLELPVAHDRS